MGTEPALLRGQKGRRCCPLEAPTVASMTTLNIPTFLSKLALPTRGTEAKWPWLTVPDDHRDLLITTAPKALRLDLQNGLRCPSVGFP